MGVKNLRNLDIYVPNFDHHLNMMLDKITPEQKEAMPSELAFKVFKNGVGVVDKLNFTEKMFMLSTCFKQTIIIMTEAEDSGVGVKEFRDAVKAQQGKIKNGELLDELKIPTVYIQADKELMRSLLYINHVQCSEIYNLIRAAHPKEFSKKEMKFREFQRALSGLFNTLMTYEGNKKKVIMQYNLDVPRLYALLYFYGGEQYGKDFYNVAFRHAYTSNRGDLSGALSILHRDGYLSRRGARSHLKYSITSKGIELLTKVINKLIYNY